MVRSLHRGEFHRHGDINVTSPGKDISLRRIAGLKRDAHMMSLSGAELSKLTERDFRRCHALQNCDSAGSSARVKQIVASAPDPIRRKPRTTFDLTDPVGFKRTSRHHGSLIAHGPIKTTQCRAQLEAVRTISLRQSTKTRRFNGVKSTFSRRQVPSDESDRAPNLLRNHDGSFSNIGILSKNLSQTGIINGSK